MCDAIARIKHTTHGNIINITVCFCHTVIYLDRVHVRVNVKIFAKCVRECVGRFILDFSLQVHFNFNKIRIRLKNPCYFHASHIHFLLSYYVRMQIRESLKLNGLIVVVAVFICSPLSMIVILG